MSDSTPRFLARLAPMIYGPSMLFAMGSGALIPTVPILASELGADLGMSGLVVSMLVLGQLVGNAPGSWVVSRVGERVAMLLAAGIAFVAGIGMLFVTHLALLALTVFCVGLSTAVFGLARLAFMTTRVPLAFRARALSLLGGSFRAGMFAGPFVATLALSLSGEVRSSVWVLLAALVLVALLVCIGRDPAEVAPVLPITEGVPIFEGSMLDALKEKRAPLARLGVAAASLSGVRAARDVALPLWGISLGLEPHTITLIVGISGAMDFALFYLSGQVMDRWGRGWAAVPAMLVLGVGFTMLSFTHDVAGAATWFVVCAMLLGIGNGLSSGVLMTLGSDLAPRGNPAPFLGVWRTLSDCGGAGMPLGISALATLSLPIACAGVGIIALLGAAGFARWIPRFIGGGGAKRSA